MALGQEVFLVLGLSLIQAILVEGLSWLFVYRTASYKRLKEEIDRSSKRLEAIKAGAVTASKSKNKKEQRLSGNVQSAALTLNTTRFKTNAIRIALMVVAWRLLARWFKGVPVARLPFEPPRFMRAATHSGLEGEDFYQCAAPFIFFTAFVSLAGNLQKLMDVAPSRAAAKLTNPQNWVQQMEAKHK